MNLLQTIKKLSTREVVLRGSKVTVRALSARESQSIHEQIPDPVVKVDSDLKHPDFIRSREKAKSDRRTLIAAAATGITNLGGEAWTKDRTGAWCLQLVEQVKDELTESEISLLYVEQGRAEGIFGEPDSTIGSGATLGNSSAPSGSPKTAN